MAFALAPGVSFCECQGRFIFLDLQRGRYFALGADANRAFGKLVEKARLGPDHERALSGLVREGLLVTCADMAMPVGCSAPPLPTRSVAGAAADVGLTDVCWSVARITFANLALKRRPLKHVLGRLARRKASQGRCEPPEDELLELASALRRAALLMSPLDQCLPRSLAAAHLLLDRGYRSKVVIAVRVQPFAAHCWLQSDSLLVNETAEEARNFTPILVI